MHERKTHAHVTTDSFFFKLHFSFSFSEEEERGESRWTRTKRRTTPLKKKKEQLIKIEGCENDRVATKLFHSLPVVN